VSGTTSLTVEFVTDISGYAWNPVYSALTSGSYTLLPYLLIKASSVWGRYNFNANAQAFGDTRLNSLAVTGAISGASVDTGQGATDVHLMNQNLRTTDNVSFANINPPVDNADSSLPSIGKGGFTYGAVGDQSTITLPTGGTYITIGITSSGNGVGGLTGRFSGGTELFSPSASKIFVWRIA